MTDEIGRSSGNVHGRRKNRGRAGMPKKRLWVDYKVLPRVMYTSLPEHPKRVVREYKRYASGRPRINMNNPELRQYNILMVDIDGGNGALAVHDAELPPPWLIVGSRDNASGIRAYRPHVYWKLTRPVRQDRPKEYALFKRISKRICDLLREQGCEVDAGQKILQKNPDYPEWDVIPGENRSWTLYELAEALNMDLQERDCDDLQSQSHLRLKYQGADDHQTSPEDGRNCYVFHNVREHAYRAAYDAPDAATLFTVVLEECHKAADQAASHHGSDRQCLNELRHIAKSISNFAWRCFGLPRRRYRGGSRNGPRAHMIPNGSSVKHAQTISAMVTNSQRSAATWQIVREARANIPDLTKKGASRLLALSLPTIRKYWDLESSADLPSVRKADALQGDFTPGNHTECGHPSTSKKTAGDVSEEGVKSALIRVKPPFGELRPTKGEMTGGRSNSEGKNPGLFRDRRVSLKRLPDLEDYSACGTSSGYAGVINDDPQPWPAGGKGCHVPREYQTPVRPRNGAGKRRKRKSSLVIDYHDLFTIDEILGFALRGSSLTPGLRLRTNS